MLKLYLAKSGLESCLGSEKWSEILDFLERAGARSTRRQLRQSCGYWWIQLKGDRHLAAMKHAHGGIPRLTYRDLALVSITLLGRHLGDRWRLRPCNQARVTTPKGAARQEIRNLEIRRAL